MTNKILVLGFFGFGNNQLDGQTIKTRNIYGLLERKKQQYGYKLSSFDTQIFKSSKIQIFKMFVQILSTDILIYVAAHNNLKYLFPIIYFITKIKKTPIHYVVVGGWLSEFIETKPIHIKLLRKIKGIYPQTKVLTEELQEKYHFENVFQLNNFRLNNSSIETTSLTKNSFTKLKIVFMARVHPMKGVDILFNLANRLKSLNIENISLDIYGPIFTEYLQEFEEKINSHDLVFYKGVLQPNEIHSVLREYDLMLFPTKYYTEGFPGSILDAYISGIPVIATSWRYAEEFIEHDVCGIITKFDDECDFIKTTLELLMDPDKIVRMKKAALIQARKYSVDTAWSVLKEKIL